MAESLFIAPYTPDALKQVLALEEENPSPWTGSQLQDQVRQPVSWQFVARRAKMAPVIGYVCGRSVAGEAEILRMAVALSCRRLGVGNALLRQVLSRMAQNDVARCFLEVRAANTPARLLYEKNGFRETAVRKGYYRDPLEDAVVMMLKL